jgi:dihydroxyacetone kinase-like protein
MRSLEEVTRIAQETADSCRSVGAALTSCTIPQAGKSTFEIADDEMEMGMGIHGEPGVWRDKLKPADEIAHEMVDRLIADRAIGSVDRLSVLVIVWVQLLLRNSTFSTELSKSGLKI